jgi:hypothetical protein
VLNIVAHGTLGVLIRAIRRQCSHQGRSPGFAECHSKANHASCSACLVAEVIANVEANAE